jgi:hypothetical protein
MKRLLSLFLFVSSLSLAQSTTVTGTVTDADGNVWASGNVTATFVPNVLTPLSQYVWTGGAITNVTGTLNSSGAFSISVPSLAYITPTNGSWNISVCPYASGSCYGINTTLVTGASVSLTTQLSAAAKGPRFQAAPSPSGYADAEVLTPPGPGYFYWNVVNAAQRIWNGSAWVQGANGGGTSVTPTNFSGYGDAIKTTGGCSITATQFTVSCGSPISFSAADIGKQAWVRGAGTAGVALHTTIASVASSSSVVLAAAAVTSVSGAYMIYGHDDVAAVQACYDWSAQHQVPCVLNAAGGYLIGSGGLLWSYSPGLNNVNGGSNIQGNSSQGGTNLFCEYNGDCLSLPPGPNQGSTLANVNFDMDQTQPSTRGINLNAATGTYKGVAATTGGLYNAILDNVNIEWPALECLWSQGGGGEGYTYNLPEQYITYNNFNCILPNQSHTANGIKMTGQHAQIIFINGQTAGFTESSNYSNWLVAIEEKDSGLGDSPTDVKFFGYTIEVGEEGLLVGEGSSNIHFDNGYMENIGNPFSATSSNGITFNGNHIANSGNTTAVVQLNGVTGSVRDNYIYGATTPAAFCSGSNANGVDFAGNTSSVISTSGCVTNQYGPTTSTLVLPNGNTFILNGSSTAISTITNTSVSPGKTLTIDAFSSPGLMFTTGGNLHFGGLATPLYVPNGGTITFTLMDFGVGWVVTAVTAPTAFTQPAANYTAGTCTMSGTSCSFTAGVGYNTPYCVASQQGGSSTVYAATCYETGTTVVITAATTNTSTWGAIVFGDPN